MNQLQSADPRAEPRTNMFLGAVIRSAGLSFPVKVRNMSVSGALAEGRGLPEEGADVELVRGSLAVSATVAWCSEGRCGLRFSSLACIRDWLAPPTNPGQQRVDEAVRVLKLGAVPMPHRSASLSETSRGNQSARFGQDLRQVGRLIQHLSQAISSDGDAVIRHAGELQNLDIALQTIAALADAIESGASDSASALRLDSLRATCAAALHKCATAPSAVPLP